MKILAVTNNIIKLREVYKNNHIYYSQYRYPVLSCDTFTFSGKNSKKDNNDNDLEVARFYYKPPENEPISNKAEEELIKDTVNNYANYILPCPCCGDIMIPPNIYYKLQREITRNPRTTILLLNKMEKYMHPVEKNIFSMIKKEHKKHPDRNFHEILISKRPQAEKELIREQTEILNSILLLSRNIPKKYQQEINNLIKNTYSQIFNQEPQATFRRKKFIEKLENCIENIENQEMEEHTNYLSPSEKRTYYRIIKKTYKMPTSYNSVPAFIVKYSKQEYSHKNIATRLISGSVATVEHALPSVLGGETSYNNLINECAKCNSTRREDDVMTQLKEHPNMPQNMQRHFNRLIELSKQHKVDKSYICEIAATYYQLSNGKIDIDLSELWE